MTVLEYLGTFAGAISGVRLASMKRFDWFGAYVIGFLTALGGGTLRDIMLKVHPFWMQDGSYVLTTLLAVVAVWLFGRRFISGQITWFIFDTIAISVFMVLGMEKTIMVIEAESPGVDCAWWVAIIMGIITAVFGGVLRDISINVVPLIFRKELYAMACAAGGLIWYGLYWIGVEDAYVRYIAAVVTIFIIRALAIKYHLGVPVLTGRGKHIHMRHKAEKERQ
ncbi:MAG: trimeric intracellular cation channel family protein [Kiritimatiellia bacterium]